MSLKYIAFKFWKIPRPTSIWYNANQYYFQTNGKAIQYAKNYIIKQENKIPRFINFSITKCKDSFDEYFLKGKYEIL